MEEEIEKKIKDLKKFIKQKTDQGTANYLGKEIRELCGMVETQALNQHDVSGRSELLKAFAIWLQTKIWEGGDKDFDELVDDFLSL